MKTRFFYIIPFSFLIIFSIGCKPDTNDLIGEWKLDKVIYIDTTVIIDGFYPWLEMSFSDDIIYDFQENKKLVVTCFVSDEAQKSKYSYTYDGSNGELLSNLQIDKQNLYCNISLEKATMLISGFIRGEKIIDEIDLAISEKVGVLSYDKHFVKLK